MSQLPGPVSGDPREGSPPQNGAMTCFVAHGMASGLTFSKRNIKKESARISTGSRFRRRRCNRQFLSYRLHGPHSLSNGVWWWVAGEAAILFPRTYSVGSGALARASRRLRKTSVFPELDFSELGFNMTRHFHHVHQQHKTAYREQPPTAGSPCS